MAKHLIACECGRQLAVEAGRAGETLRCDCGAWVTVPTLRRLRELPVAGDERGVAAPTWEVRHGVMTALGIVAVASLSVAGVTWWNRPVEPVFNPAGWAQQTERGISELTPVAAWRSYYESYRPLAAMGFLEFVHPNSQAIRQEIDSRRWLRNALLSVAAISLTVVVAVALAGRTKESRRLKRS